MAITYKFISSNILTTTTASVTFSSIPQTYTDLVLRIVSKQDGASNGGRLTLQFNGDSSTNYSRIGFSLSNSSIGNINNTSQNYFRSQDATAVSDTANTFGVAQIYIPNYRNTSSRAIGNTGVAESANVTATGPAIVAGLYRGTAAITSITIADFISSWNFVSGSKFYLFGISNT